MTIGEDGRPYIAVRRRTEEEKEKYREEIRKYGSINGKRKIQDKGGRIMQKRRSST